jgi:hypothetical protein
MKYRIRTVKTSHEWTELFRAVDVPHLPQSFAYGEAKRIAEGWHVNRCVFENSSSAIAICQVLEKRVAGLRVASRINRGPLFISRSPSFEERENVFALIRQNWRWHRGGPLLIAPALEDSEENKAIMRQLGFRDRMKDGWCSSLIDLRQDVEVLHDRMTREWRNRLRSANRSGLTLQCDASSESVKWILERHADNMRAKKFRSPAPKLVEALYKASPKDFLVLKAVLDGEQVAGFVLAFCETKADYYIGWFGDKGRKCNSGNFLYWSAVLEAKRAGLKWMDLGGYYSTDKFGHFKLSMRGVEYKLAGEWMSL